MASAVLTAVLTRSDNTLSLVCPPEIIAIPFVAPLRSALLRRQVKGEDAVQLFWALQHLREAERTRCIVVASLPVFFHRPARKLVMHRGSFVSPRAVDELDDVVDFLVRLGREHF